jgi:hypothetical protein
MAEVSDAKLDRIRGLLAKAEATTAGPEADAFMAKANELMARFGIERAMLDDQDEAVSPEVQRVRIVAPYTIDKLQLMAGIGAVYNCRLTYSRQRGPERIVSLFGFRSDIDRVLMMFRSLNLQMQRALATAPGPWGGESRTSYNKSFMAQYTATVTDRMRQALDKATAETPATAMGRSAELVLIDRGKQVERFRDEYFGQKLKPARARRLSGTGWNDGHEAGLRADLEGGRLPSAGRSQLDRS